MSESTSHPQVTVGIGQRYDSVYLRNGEVDVPGFGVTYPLPPRSEATAPTTQRVAGDKPYVAPSSIFTAMATAPPFDAGELAFSTYLQARDLGKPLHAIPVFPSRMFPHSQILVAEGSPIRSPKDLAGKRVCASSFAKNYAVWLRGALAHQYAVPVEEIIWVENVPEHYEEYRAPSRFRLERLPVGADVCTLLECGALDAVSMPRGTRRAKLKVRPLFANPYTEVRDYCERSGVFPINTVVILPSTALAKYPTLPGALFSAFSEALDLYRRAVEDGSREDEHSGLSLRKLRDEAGISLPDYGLSANRRTIETMVQYCLEQGIISKPFTLEELFLLPET